MRYVYFFAFHLLICSCRQKEAAPPGKVTYLVTKERDSYGYIIFIDDKKIIDQPHIPGLAAIKGYSDSAKAGMAARFIVGKILNDQWPPSVNARELDSLGVLD